MLILPDIADIASITHESLDRCIHFLTAYALLNDDISDTNAYNDYITSYTTKMLETHSTTLLAIDCLCDDELNYFTLIAEYDPTLTIYDNTTRPAELTHLTLIADTYHTTLYSLDCADNSDTDPLAAQYPTLPKGPQNAH